MNALSRADLTAFFRELGQRLPGPARLILTGGSEAMLLGGSRPTRDIDFGIVPLARGRASWPEIERAIADAAAEVGVVVQYSEDIDRWSSVAIPRTRFRTRLLRRTGRLSVHLLDPACWAVYKLARYLDSDAEDLVAVLRRQRVSDLRLARLCGQSLRSSPRSPALFSFRKQVEHFLTEHGPSVWGRGFNPSRPIATFRRAAGMVR